MSAWPGKYAIGLTGNIATGKSVVRKMLEHLGAYGIDADALGHRAIALGSPGYQPVVESFGKWILSPDGQVDRVRLGRIVFADPEALARLESIVHPFVIQAVDVLVRRSKHKVIVIEAIKLLESSLRSKCDNIWVVYAAQDIQLSRLVQKRGMSNEAARQRVASQPPQKEKIALANAVIRNDGSFEDTWKQVSIAWQSLFPVMEPAPVRAFQTLKGELIVQRGRPKQAEEIATFINRVSGGRRRLTREDVMASFGEKAYLLLTMDEKLIGLVGWQVENLVARTNDVYVDPILPFGEGVRVLLDEVENTSRDLQCEAALLFLPKELLRQESLWQSLGYQSRTVASLSVRAWQEAAAESMPAESILLFKQLRKDRVLRPV
jgi:dephospho-CoA kinase